MSYEDLLEGMVKAMIVNFSIYGLDDGDIDLIERYREKLVEDKKEIPEHLSTFLNSSLYIERHNDLPEIEMVERVGTTGIRVKLSAYVLLKDEDKIEDFDLSPLMNENFILWEDVEIDSALYFGKYNELQERHKEKIKIKDDGYENLFILEISAFLKSNFKSDSEEELINKMHENYNNSRIEIIKNGAVLSANPYFEDSDLFIAKSYV